MIDQLLKQLENLGTEANKRQMAKFGINVSKAYGVNVEDIRVMAKEIGKNHDIATKLWKTGNHEARILATIVADPELTDINLLQDWVIDINSWDLCDQFCNNLVINTEHVDLLIIDWCIQEETFVKRAGFSTMAVYALKNDELREKDIDGFFGLILNECWDKRNYVRKAVSWALKNIGKKDIHLNRKAVKIAKQMKEEKLKPAKETASEVLKEIQTPELINKLKEKHEKLEASE